LNIIGTLILVILLELKINYKSAIYKTFIYVPKTSVYSAIFINVGFVGLLAAPYDGVSLFNHVTSFYVYLGFHSYKSYYKSQQESSLFTLDIDNAPFQHCFFHTQWLLWDIYRYMPCSAYISWPRQVYFLLDRYC
jgi:hypothetical protein